MLRFKFREMHLAFQTYKMQTGMLLIAITIKYYAFLEEKTG